MCLGCRDACLGHSTAGCRPLCSCCLQEPLSFHINCRCPMTECGRPGWRKVLSGPGLCWVPEFASPGRLCVYEDGGLGLLEGQTWNLVKWSQSSALTAAQEGGQWEQHLLGRAEKSAARFWGAGVPR